MTRGRPGWQPDGGTEEIRGQQEVDRDGANTRRSYDEAASECSISICKPASWKIVSLPVIANLGVIVLTTSGYVLMTPSPPVPRPTRAAPPSRRRSS